MKNSDKLSFKTEKQIVTSSKEGMNWVDMFSTHTMSINSHQLTISIKFNKQTRIQPPIISANII
jgi:hypothetical protein